MKTFSFPLDRVLHWRRLECERERAKLTGLMSALKAAEQRAEALKEERRATARSIVNAPTITGAEVTTVFDWQAAMRTNQEKLAVEISQAAGHVQRQTAVVREAERRVKLLDRLHENRWEEWSADLAREEEAFAAEAYIARYTRLK
jgi:flagellar export protein FliJ